MIVEQLPPKFEKRLSDFVLTIRNLLGADLRSNVESLLKPPLPEEDLLRLKEIFGRVNCVTGD